ncbi:Hypothetical predicted protein [Olea europaea subsp. europaea]|uniref:Uncharacterized protein n=1 Tax=Olea europaea subsp. europaea TaxID=158383 RepID=A0A8S0SC92_OLEEU|nr:Hypothetical predicted protein [Olea europaea subsp. europaea]
MEVATGGTGGSGSEGINQRKQCARDKKNLVIEGRKSEGKVGVIAGENGGEDGGILRAKKKGRLKRSKNMQKKRIHEESDNVVRTEKRDWQEGSGNKKVN